MEPIILKMSFFPGSLFLFLFNIKAQSSGFLTCRSTQTMNPMFKNSNDIGFGISFKSIRLEHWFN